MSRHRKKKKNKDPFFRGTFSEDFVNKYGNYMNPEGEMVDLNKIYGTIMGQNTARGAGSRRQTSSRFASGYSDYYEGASDGASRQNIGADKDRDGFFDNNPQLESYFEGYSRLMEGYAGAEQMIGQAESQIQSLNEKYTDIISENTAILASAGASAMAGGTSQYSQEELDNAKNALIQAEQDYKNEISGITTKYGTDAYNFKKSFYQEAFPFINAAFESRDGDTTMSNYYVGDETYAARSAYAPDLLDQITRFDIQGSSRANYKPKVPLLYGDDELYANLYDARGLSNTHMRQELEDAANENRPINEDNFVYGVDKDNNPQIRARGKTGVYNIKSYMTSQDRQGNTTYAGGPQGYRNPIQGITSALNRPEFGEMNMFSDPNFLNKYGMNTDEDHSFAVPSTPSQPVPEEPRRRQGDFIRERRR